MIHESRFNIDIVTFRIKEVKADTVYTMLAVHVPEIREPGSLLSLLTPRSFPRADHRYGGQAQKQHRYPDGHK
jgi:hypothetical protein